MADEEERMRMAESPVEWPALDPPGLVLRMPLEPPGLTERLTPTRDLFVLAHLGMPRVDAGRWALRVDGLVERPLSLGLAQLKALPAREVEAFLQCAGNPATPTVPARLVANARWRGVELARVLEAAGVCADARYLWTYGLDRGEFMGLRSDPYVKDLPLARVAAGDVLLAYEMNGETLPVEHGFPLRLLVAGFYGTNSVKWLYRIELTDRRAPGPFTTTLYNDTVVDATGEPRRQPVWHVAPESLIVSPAPDASVELTAGGTTLDVHGWAWGHEAIAQVDVSSDAGRTWSMASLEPRRDRAWQRFEMHWTPPCAGEFELQCRATDVTGRSQPASGARNAIHSVRVRVERRG
jgi:sulfane dehydrogenase subunit SoxC